MNKKNYSLFVASMMLLAGTSCTQDEVIKNSSSDQMTTFKVSLEGEANSRTAGDGKTVDILYYEVYQGDKKVLDNHGEDANADPVTKNEAGGFIVEMPIMRGEKYDIMFWAEAENSVYDATDLQEIKVNYDVVAANKEAYDAFFYGEENFIATNNETTIVLTRPFGQLNVGTTVADWEKAKTMIADGDPVTKSEVKVKGLANRFNVLTHVASIHGEVGEVTFEKADLNGETFDVKVSDTEKAEYQNLAMNYLLVPTSQDKHQGNVDITTTFWRVDTEKLFDIVLPNVPVQRNWRTNILGDLLAADKTFEIVIDPIFADDYNYPKTMEEQLRMAAAIGGEVTLTEDVALSQSLQVQYDMTINLNGKNITVANESNELGEGDGIIVTGGKLTINGEGTVKANTRALWARGNGGAEIVINGGKYVGATTASANSEVIYVSGNGKISIYGGSFEAVNQSDAFATAQYAVLNLHGNGKTGCDIKVYGGMFKNFNPADNISENPKQSFVAEGYEVVTKTVGTDTWYSVIGDVTDIVLHDDHAEVYTAEGLLEFVNIVNSETNHAKNGYDLKLMDNIEMPLFTIAQNAEGKYEFTDTPITLDEKGVPSGSNWIPICGEINDLSEGFNGTIDGNNFTISNLYIKKNSNYTGLVGFMYDNGKIKNLTIANSVIKGTTYTGIVGGRSQHGSRIENVHVVKSSIMGDGHVGGIVGYNYRRDKVGVDEDFAYVKDCTTDKDTKVVATGDNVGGICGTNYGAIIINCVNNADVTGKSAVGGVVGYSRDYYSNADGSIVADGYVLASQNTAYAHVTAINGSAGGIIGSSLADNSHDYTKFYAVACHSASDVEGNTMGAIIGNVTHKGTIVASWAEKKGNLEIAGKGSPAIIQSALYENAVDITQTIVAEMNAAIAEFSRTNAEEIECPYQWKWVNGSWPELVPSANNN